MISYAIQGATLLIFGPIFLFTVVLVDAQTDPFSYFRSPQNRSRWVNLYLVLTTPTHKLNAFTAACVVISTSIRRGSTDPVFEDQFISLLSQYQFAICLLGSTLYVFCCPIDSKIQYVLHVTLFSVVLACLITKSTDSLFSQILVDPPEGEGNGRYLLSALISKDCDTLRGYPPPASFRSMNPSGAGVQILSLCIGFAFVMTFLLVAHRLGSDSSLFRIILRNTSQSLRYMSSWFSPALLFSWRGRATGRLRPGLLVTLCASFIFTAGTSFSIINLFIALLKSRDRMRKFVKDEYEDNDWGFGQILAVAVWVAWLVDAIFLIAGTFMFIRSSGIYLTTAEAFLPEHFVRPRRTQSSHDIGSSTPRLDQQQPNQALSTIPENQEQATGVDGLVSGCHC